MTIDFDSTIPGIVPDFDTTARTRALGTECDALTPPTMTAREWMSLGALCAEASEKMAKAGSYAAARHYAALARKCDRMFEES